MYCDLLCGGGVPTFFLLKGIVWAKNVAVTDVDIAIIAKIGHVIFIVSQSMALLLVQSGRCNVKIA